jgi:deazaflavin-dependent oxidoreductase (nitroreductase family)
LNLEADSSVRIQIGNDTWAATAEVITGPEREALWSRVVETWPGYHNYQARTTRELPLVVLTRAS